MVTHVDCDMADDSRVIWQANVLGLVVVVVAVGSQGRARLIVIDYKGALDIDVDIAGVLDGTVDLFGVAVVVGADGMEFLRVHCQSVAVAVLLQ